MDLFQLRKIGELFLELENKKFPEHANNSITAVHRQVGTMSVFISEKNANKMIKMLEEELKGLE